eukprot:CAMPEP_0202463082 /NCGR_PEP_ID=MMETSP1360-20130828/56637_1 /ASSEMBLY_ACC=CAM_ASM_000848 /TAXON_ID=515479 /ORGANISM="Licmophora paradoxa, Strain CCMP2313" /LENGTH=78 /DNA_ID=CAMNT_0049085815 /DNA_START=300 /DNA_END=536 /DNA_ORIENTATION=+
MMQQAEGDDGFDNHNITVIGVLVFLFTVPVMRVFLNAFAPTIDMNALMTEAVDLETMAYYLVGGYTLWKVTSAATAIF